MPSVGSRRRARSPGALQGGVIEGRLISCGSVFSGGWFRGHNGGSFGGIADIDCVVLFVCRSTGSQNSILLMQSELSHYLLVARGGSLRGLASMVWRCAAKWRCGCGWGFAD